MLKIFFSSQSKGECDGIGLGRIPCGQQKTSSLSINMTNTYLSELLHYLLLPFVCSIVYYMLLYVYYMLYVYMLVLYV